MPPILQILQSKWSNALLGAILFLGTTAYLCLRSIPKIAQGAPTRAAATSDPVVPSWNFHNPEIDQLVESLKEERKKVADRETKLNDLELRIGTERTELQQIMQNIKKMEQDLDAQILHVQEAEVTNLKKLAKTYAAMKPAGAIGILKELDDEAIAKILLFMKETESAPILEAFAKLSDTEAKRAANISERLRLSTAAALPGKK